MRQCLTAVADAIFLCGSQFGGSFTEFGYKKIRIITKPAFAPRLIDDFAVPRAIDDDWLRIIGVANQNNDAVILRTAVGFVLQRFD